jgi:hypothetical protein
MPLYQYDSLQRMLSTLVPFFDLEDRRTQIMRAYELICKESLSIDLDQRPQQFSRINRDGTPFQISLSLGPKRLSLQFLGEAGIPGSSCLDRMKLNRERIRSLIDLLCPAGDTCEIEELLDRLAPIDNSDLLADLAGAFWLGTSFSEASKLKIYINAKWGCDDKRWTRLNYFAAYFDRAEKWREMQGLLQDGMEPLGMDLILGEDSSLGGRAYVSAHGNHFEYYESLIRSISDDRFYELFQYFIDTFLGEGRKYPTGSVVCSFGFNTFEDLDFKIEFCGHCIFTSDAEAKDKCLNWLASLNIDPSMYLRVLDVLSQGNISEKRTDLHCFLGIGSRHGEAYSTVYLKPNLMPPLESP